MERFDCYLKVSKNSVNEKENVKTLSNVTTSTTINY